MNVDRVYSVACFSYSCQIYVFIQMILQVEITIGLFFLESKDFHKLEVLL